MKRISVRDASILGFLVRNQTATEEQVDSVLMKAHPSLRAALRNARNAAMGKKTNAKSLGSKTGRFAREAMKAVR